MKNKNTFSESYNFLERTFVQGDSRYLDPYFTKIIAQFITQEVVEVTECKIQFISEPSAENLSKINEPIKLFKFVRGHAWGPVFKEYKEKQSKSLENIKNPLDNLS